MDIFHFHHATGEFLGNGSADENPLDPETPLVPANATPVAPMAISVGSVALYLCSDGTVPSNWVDGQWQLQPDYRNVPLFSIRDGSPYRVGDVYSGIGPIPPGVTLEERPSLAHFWGGSTWELDAAEVMRLQRIENMKMRDAHMEHARDAIVPLQLAAELAVATEAEAAQLLSWKRYIVALNRIDVGAAAIQWPEPPAS